MLVLHSSDELYGSDRVLLSVLDGLGWRVTPIVVIPTDVPPGGLSEELRSRGIEVRRLPLPVMRRRHLTPLGLAWLWIASIVGILQLARIGRARRIRAVHTNTATILIGPGVAWLLRVPHVWHIHEIVERPRWLGRAIALATCAGRQRVVAVSQAAAHRLMADGGRVSDVLLNPAPDVADPGPPASGEYPIVLMAGRVNGRKGHDVFVQAAVLLHDSGVQARFEMAGGPVPGQPEAYDDLKALVDSHDPSASWLTFDGWVDDLDARIIDASIVVLPTTGSESLNIIALEAMARRRPVVASRAGGLVEAVDDGETGLLVPSGDPIALAEAIRGLLSDPVTADRMGRTGRRRALSTFSGASYADAWRRLYDGILCA